MSDVHFGPRAGVGSSAPTSWCFCVCAESGLEARPAALLFRRKVMLAGAPGRERQSSVFVCVCVCRGRVSVQASIWTPPHSRPPRQAGKGARSA